MVGLLIDDKSSLEVAEKIRDLKARLMKTGFDFGSLIPLPLTDNGSEFTDVVAIENDFDGVKQTSLFFCDPYKSCQKAKIEKNHKGK